MALKFSVAIIDQRDQINDLMLAAFDPYVKKLRPDASAGPYEWLPDAIKNGEIYVVVEAGIVVGAVVIKVENQQLYIDQLSVDPSRQNSGIGGWLMARIEQLARGKKLNAITLFTAEIMDNLLRFYSRHGYNIIRKSLPDHGRDEYMRVHMAKKL